MYICPICNNHKGEPRGVGAHIRTAHNENPVDILFESYPELFNDCLFCGKKIKSYKSGKQNSKFCDKDCECSWRKGRKQSQETIEKRIRNTNQKKKEETRNKTMMEKYSSLHYTADKTARSEKISKALTGREKTPEHLKKIADARKTNGTSKHTPETKRKIAESIRRYYNDENIDHCVTIPKEGKGGRGYKQGYFNDLYYRSSYELRFLQLCEKYNIKVESAATKEFRIRYEYEGKNRYYYPDFYLPEYDVVCEIKAIGMLDFDSNFDKMTNAARKFSYWVVTEEELDDEIFISEVNSFEHILS